MLRTAAPTNSKVKAWQLGVDWKIVGPHGLRAAYVKVDDVSGTPGAPAVAGSGSIRPGVPVAGAPNDTGADMWQIRYVYTFSKRTEFNFGYVKLDNDGSAAAGGGAYTLGGLGAAVAPGNNQDAWALSHHGLRFFLARLFTALVAGTEIRDAGVERLDDHRRGLRVLDQ